jgi:hypothetical protein
VSLIFLMQNACINQGETFIIYHFRLISPSLSSFFSQFKMKPQIHSVEDDCPVTTPDGFPKDDELQFEIEMLDFFKAKVCLIK